jgi:trehalose 6-phosphate phosphatase
LVVVVPRTAGDAEQLDRTDRHEPSRRVSPAEPAVDGVASPSIDHALDRLIGTERLLVGLDYDGTLAQIVDDPRDATPHAGSVSALTDLAQVPSVTCAVISGRERSVLAELSGLGPPVLLIGCHGADGGDERSLPRPSDVAQLRRCADELAARNRGVIVEEKPTGVALHYRRVAADQRDRVRADIERALRDLGSTVASLLHGKLVVEAGVVPLDKGAALERLRRVTGVDGVLFIGDDVTDESAFARLGPDDVGVKVGAEPTIARYRVGDVAAVGLLLQTLLAGVSAARR